ncbi:MAG: serine/threonine protein kinase, partial [Planctomycetaceae bacterium]|nr:serine/threonine protein kinase [Planctomycetaceae bacterium]
IITDYISGADAAMLIKQHGPLEIGRAVRLMDQALEALHYAHQEGFVHRDVKPSNLLVSGEGDEERCHLADFGLARVYHESRMSGLTLFGDAGGTMQFMPPEQVINFRGVGPAADQYSAAATLYYLCSGKHLFPSHESQDIRLRRIIEDTPIPLSSHNPQVPPLLADAIQRGLAKDPALRFPSIADFQAAIRPFASEGGPSLGE